MNQASRANSSFEVTPLIGITGRRYVATALHGPEMEVTLAGLWMDGYHAAYVEKLGALGAMPVYLAREADPERLVERLDGLILAGGLDVDPRLYGDRPTEHSTLLDPVQDEYEIELARLAVAHEMPILGTCRGHELLNVAFGGTLRPHLDGIGAPHHRRIIYPLTDRGHEVRFAEGSILHELYGGSAVVNSFHHQAVERVGEGIRVTAFAEDDVVEGIELEGANAIGVQWHPEFVADSEPILQWLVDRAAETASKRVAEPLPSVGDVP